MLYASTSPGAYSAEAGMDEIESLKFYLVAALPADILGYAHAGLSRNVRYYYAVTSVNEEGLENSVHRSIVSQAVQGRVPAFKRGGELDCRGVLRGEPGVCRYNS